MPRTATHTVVLTVAATLAALGVLAAGAGAAVLFGGWYDIGATAPHWQPVHTLLESGMAYSVRRHARDIVPPRLDAGHVTRGARVYRAVCQQCHGGPGAAQSAIGQSMQPVPGPLVDASRHWRTRELYWITRHGIKMSGMPAWQFHLDEGDLWAVVAFVQALPTLSARRYAALTEQEGAPAAARGLVTAPADAGPETAAAPWRSHAGAPVTQAAGRAFGSPAAIRRGRLALTQYACHACHRIPGVTGAEVHVGPPLRGIARQALLAGSLPNSPDNLVRWIRDPQAINPGTAMPRLGVTEADARDMAAYLLTQK